MRKFIKYLILASIFIVPKLTFSQNIQYLGTKDNIVVTRNISRDDTAHEFALTDTSKHPTRPGRMVSFNGSPYWWNGIYWYKLNGDTAGGGGQVNSDWNATSGVAKILNKPTLATVAITGSYTDLSNPPTIPAAQINSDWGAVSGLSQILNKPRFVDSIYRIVGKDSIFFVINRNGTLFTHSILDSAGGSSGGGGTVDSVFAGNLSPLFTTTITNQAIKPTINFTPQNVTAHKYYGNGTGSTGLPAFGSIGLADIPTIPISQTDIKAGTGILISGDSLYADTTLLATNSDLSLKQNVLNGTGYIKQSGTTPSYLTPTQVTADLNIFTTTLKGEVPAPTTVTGKVLSDAGTWVPQSGGVDSANGDAHGTAVGVILPLTLNNVNANIFSTQTLVKLSVNGKGLITGATAASVTDITGALHYTPYYSNDTLTTLATKSDLSQIDTIRLIPVGTSGLSLLYARNDTIFQKKIVGAIQNSDSSITVGNLVASNNLSDVSNVISALNNLLPSQGGNSGKALVTNGSTSSWQTVSGGSGTTNLGLVHKVSYDSLTSSSGTGVILDTATTSQAGLESLLDKTKLMHPIVYINDSDVVSINVDTLTYGNGDSLNFKALSYLPGIKHFSTQGVIYLGLDTSYVKTLSGWGITIPPNRGSGFRIYSPQIPAFNSIVAGTNIAIDSTSNTGSLTISVPNLTRQVLTTGTTATGTSGNLLVTFNFASTVSAFTFTMPSSPTDQQTVEFEGGGTIASGTAEVTTLTISPNSGQTVKGQSTLNTFNAGEYAKFKYNTTLSAWMREQ